MSFLRPSSIFMNQIRPRYKFTKFRGICILNHSSVFKQLTQQFQNAAELKLNMTAFHKCVAKTKTGLTPKIDVVYKNQLTPFDFALVVNLHENVTKLYWVNAALQICLVAATERLLLIFNKCKALVHAVALSGRQSTTLAHLCWQTPDLGHMWLQ